MKRLKSITLDFGIVCLFIAILLALTFAVMLVINPSAKAASVQQWDYGMYAYGLATQTEKGVHIWVEQKADDQKAMQAIIDTEENPDLNEVFNLAGTFGWRFVSSDKQGLLTIYVFERQIGG